MISSISGNSSIQMINALNAFKATKESEKNQAKFDIDTSDGISLKDDNILNRINLNEVKNFAQTIGEQVSDEDIKYGLTYGRSVIADFIA